MREICTSGSVGALGRNPQGDPAILHHDSAAGLRTSGGTRNRRRLSIRPKHERCQLWVNDDCERRIVEQRVLLKDRVVIDK
jgi:hypothetical protein